jgi:urease accessory protein
MTALPRPLKIGIGGPVGSGKTALIEALVPLLIAAGQAPLVIRQDRAGGDAVAAPAR